MMSGSTSFSSAYDDVLPKELTQANFRRGKWTVEEENYTSRIIKDFENGASFFSFEEQSAVLTSSPNDAFLSSISLDPCHNSISVI